MRTFLAFIAQEMSFATAEAVDGREALDLLVHNDPREPFDVALVDWEMPRMNGLEFVQAVRRNQDFAGLKLMMVTTLNSMERVSEALELGADDFLMKPVTKELLEDKLQILGVVN
jgi:two-component system chemotaxis response regulator CheY